MVESKTLTRKQYQDFNMEDKRKILYNQLSKDYELGDFDSFSSKLDDETKRKAFYDTVSKDYDLGDYDSFVSKISVSPQSNDVSSGGVGTQEEADSIFDANMERFQNGQPIQRVSVGKNDDTQGSYQYNPEVQKHILENKPYMFKPKTVDMYGAHDKDKDVADLMNEGRLYEMQSMRAVSTLGEQLNERIKDNEKALKSAYEVRDKKLKNATPKFVFGSGANLPPKVNIDKDDEDIKNLLAEQEYLESAKKVFDAARNGSGFFQGMKDAVDASWITFGVSDLHNAERISNVQKKIELGQELSESEQSLLTSLGLQQIVNEKYNELLGSWYKAGLTTTDMVPFMAEMAINPLSGLGKTAMKASIKKFGEKGTKAVAAKILSRTIGDVAGAAGMATTTGMPSVMADALERQQGYVTTDIKDGSFIGTGLEGGESASDSWRKSITSRTIENWSEMVGNYFAPIGKTAGKITTKTFNALKLGKVNEIIDNINSSNLARILDDFTEQTQWNGSLGEFAEEQVGMIADALLVGDTKWSDITDLDQQLDVALGVGVFGTFMSLLRIGGYRTPKYRARKAVERADKDGLNVFGSEWEGIKELILASPDEELSANLAAHTEFSTEQMKAALMYANALKAQQAVNTYKEKEKIDNPDDIGIEVEYTYDEGFETTESYLKHYAKRELDFAESELGVNSRNSDEQQFAQMIISGADSPVESINALVEAGYSEEQIQKAKDYYTAYHRMNGITDALIENVDSQIESANNEVDANTNQENGSVTQVVLRNGSVGYVVQGTVVRGEKGAVDVNNSDDTIMVRLENGEIKMMNPNKDWVGVAWIESPETLKGYNNTILRESLIDKAIGEIDWNPATPNPKVGDSFEMDGIPVTIVSHDSKGGMFVVPTEEYQNALGSEQKMQQLVAKAQQTQPIPFKVYKDWASAQLDAQEEATNAQQESAIPSGPVSEKVNTEVNNPVAEEVAQPQAEVQPVVEEAPVIPTKEDGSIDFVSYGKEGTFKTLGEKYGEKMPHKIEVTSKALAEDLRKAQQKLNKAELDYDDAPIGREDKAEKALNKAREEFEAVKREADFWAEMDAEIKSAQVMPGDEAADEILSMEEPLNGLEFAAQMLANGNIKLLQDSFVSETGFGNEESKKYFGLFASAEKGGMTIQQAGERLMEADRENGTNFFDQNDPNAGRNAIIQVLGMAKTKKDLANIIPNNRAEQARREQEAEFRAYEAWVEENFHMSVGDFEAYEEVIARDLSERGLSETEYQEFMSTFVDETFNKAEDEQQGIIAESEGSSEVLPGTQPLQTEGVGRVEERPEKTDGGIVGENGAVPESSSGNEVVSQIEQARAEVDANPTEAQKEAGNYKKGHVKIDGYDITIENPKGGVRSGTDKNGKEWSITMNNDYGYIRGTEAVDGDHIDVFLSDNPTEGNVFVVDQSNEDGSFDESKVMYGFSSLEEARAAYLSNYKKGWESRIMAITEVSKDEFKKWVDSSHRKTKAFSEYKSVKAEASQGYSIEASNVSRMEDIEARITEIENERIEIEGELENLGNSNPLASAELISQLDQLDREQSELEAEYSGLRSMNDESNAILEEEGSNLRFRGQQAKEEKRRKPLRERAKEWSKKLGVKVKIMESLKDVTNASARRAIIMGETVTGWYEESTGEVCLYMPYLSSESEVDATYIHEVVAHKGLRGLLGDKFDEFCDEVWNMMSAADKAKFIKYPGVNGNTRAAADEYIAHLAENVDVTESAWGKLDELIKKFLKAIGLEPKMTNADIANTIKRSYQRLAESGNAENVGGEGTRFRFSKTPQEFDAIQKEAVEKKGIVMPGLNEAVVDVLSIDKHDFNGNLKQAREAAKQWAIENYQGKEFSLPDNGGSYTIGKKAINKYVDKTSIDKSGNAMIHLSALKELPNIISSSITGEIHADYKKGENGQRSADNGVGDKGLLIHRMFGAIELDGKVYRVKTTMNEYRDPMANNTPHSYEVTEIELIESSSTPSLKDDSKPVNVSNNSITAANLLNGVEKSYDKGKKLLSESEKTLFRTVYHGSAASFDKFDHSFMGTGEGAQAYGWGTYVTEVGGIARSYATTMASKSGVDPLSYVGEYENYVGKDVVNIAKEYIRRNSFDLKKAKEEVEHDLKLTMPALSRKGAEFLLSTTEEDWTYNPNRHLYEVEIPDDNGRNYLYWEKQYTRDELEDIASRSKGSVSVDDIDPKGVTKDGSTIKGGKIVRAMSEARGPRMPMAKEASRKLSLCGFVGIEFPAEYRTGGREDNAKNYVIFNEDDLKIVEHTRFRVVNDKNGKKTLVGLHNISESKLRKAIKQGGLANPSVAVIDMDKQSHTEYGDITFVIPSSMIDKKTGKNVGTYLADAYTPVYPTVIKKMSDKGAKALTKALESVNEIFRSKVRTFFNSYLDSGTIYDALSYWYLSDTGKNPPILEAALPDGYTREEVKNVKAVNPEATIFAELSEEERRKVIDLYIEREGGKEKYENDLANRVEGWKKSIEDENALQMRKKFSQDKLNELEEYGYEYGKIANYYSYAIRLANASSKPSEIETFRNAYDEVVKNGLEEDFGNWLMAKEEELGVEEKLFSGYDNQGRAKYVPNTLENASKLMKKDGRAGATGLGGFNYFVAILAPVAKNTKQISAKKQNLSTQEEYDRFAKKWGDHYHKLALQLQPGADKWADYGYHRLHEIAPMANPKEYAKKEYGIELSDKFIKDLNDVKNAIRNDFPARYFETKFERPVYLNEFAAAVVPQGVSEEIVNALSDAGLPVEYYEKDNNEARMEAVDKVSSEIDGIRFRIANQNQVQEEVDKFTSKYKSAPVNVLDSTTIDEQVSEWLGVKDATTEELIDWMEDKKVPAVHVRTNNNIIIFAEKIKAEKVKETLFHENLHTLLNDGAHKELVDKFYKAAKDDARFGKWKKMSDKEQYDDYERPEEFFVYVVSNGQVSDNLEDVFEYLTSKEQNELKELLNINGYDYDNRRFNEDFREENKRGSERENIESDLRGRGVESQEKGQGRNQEQAERIKNLFDKVADMGLDGVLGNEAYNSTMIKMYGALPEEVRKEVMADAVSNYSGDYVPAMHDYLIKAKANIVDKVLGAIRSALRKAGFDVDINSSDVKYLFWRSKKPLDNRNVFDVAEDISKQNEFGVNGTRFSIKNFDPSDKRDALIKEYDAYLKTGKFNFIEAFQDRMYSVKVLMDKIVNATGKKVRDYEDAYTAENQLGSINKPMQEKYLDKFYKPLLEEIKKLSDKYGREVVERYIYCKSGLERNEVLRQRDADEAYNSSKAELDEKLAKNEINQAQYNALLAQIDAQRQKILSEDVDYSGVRGMLYNVKAQQINDDYESGKIDKATRDQQLAKLEANRKNEVRDWKNFAEKQVAALEAKASTKELDALWSKINAATNETLRMDYESGMIDKETYDAEKNMMKYYVPLRNWDDTTAEEMYEYRSELVRPVSSNQKRAKGRESQADNPIATIGLMAQNAIVRGNRNKVKQKFYAFVANRETSLATVRYVWYVKDAQGNWVAEYADTSKAKNSAEFEAIINQFEEDMKLLEEQGNAFRGKQPMGMKFKASGRQKQAHVVPVMINGNEYAVYVNGNPRAAQAMNGETNSEAANEKWEWYDKIKRMYSAGLTSWNPDFIIPNMIRDGIHASTMTLLDAGPIAAAKFALNGPRAFAQVFAMISGKGKSLVNPKYQAYFEEFIANGGETGYTAINTLEDYKKEYDKLINKAKGVKASNWAKDGFSAIGGLIETANRIFEDVNRFNAYVSSRESGESIMRSVNAAKNITVNFNRKGAGFANNSVWGTVAGWMNKWILFFNPAVQSIEQFVTKSKANPKRATAMGTTILSSGFMMPIINELLVAAFGGDDEDDYWNQSDYKRRNNWMLYTGDGYVTIPLPPVLRELYGMGDIFYGTITGHITPERAVMDVARQVQSAIGFFNLIPEASQEPDMITYAKGFAPDLIAPSLDVLTNTNFMGRPIAKWTDYNKYDPEYERVYKGTSKQWIEVSKFLNELGGNEGRRSDVWGNFINPAMMEHLITSYGGGIGKTINNLAGMAIDVAEGDTENLDPFRKSPIVPRFYTPVDEKSAVPGINRKYYDYDYRYNVAKKALKNYQEGVASKEHPEYQKYIDEMKENGEIRFMNYFKSMSKQIKDIQNQIKENPKNKKELEEKLIEMKAQVSVKCAEILK